MARRYKLTPERIEDVKGLAKSFNRIDNVDEFDTEFVDMFDYDVEEEICILFIELCNKFDKEINKFRGKSGFGRGAIRTTYDMKERKILYRDAKEAASTFYKDMKKCEEFEALLDKLTDVYVQYVEKMGNSYNLETPMFIRGMIGMTAYYMLDTVRKVSIIATGEAPTNLGIQTYIIEYMIKRAKEKSNCDIFSSGRKLINEKWNMPIKTMYDEACIYAPEVPFDYAGHKDDLLGYIVREMLGHLDKTQGYSVYADVYGGSGRAILQFPIDKNKTYHMNDKHPYNYALWKCLQDNDKYKQLIRNLNKEQAEYIIIQKKIDDAIKTYPTGTFKDKKLYGNLKKLREQEFTVLNDKIHVKYDKAYNRYSFETKTSDVDMATDFVILHSFLNQGTPVAPLSSGVNMLRNLQNVLCSWVYERDFKGMKKAYQNENVKLHNEMALKLIKNLPNTKGVVLQLDPPYIFTKNYANSSFTLKNMTDLMDAINSVNSKRKFIYHCQTIYNKTASKSQKIKDAFKQFFKHWNTFKEDLFVTFIIQMNGDAKPTCTDNELITIYIDSIVARNRYENPEIIVTNFNVKISSRYHIQGYFNPYSVLLANTISDGTDFRVVTVPMKDYLPILLNKI